MRNRGGHSISASPYFYPKNHTTMKNYTNTFDDPSGSEIKRAITAVSNTIRKPVTKLTIDDVYAVDCAIQAGHLSHEYARYCFHHSSRWGWAYVCQAIHAKNSEA